MKQLYEQALREQFKNNKPHFAGADWPVDGKADYYGFEVTDISPDGSTVDLDWIFKTEEKYCCTMLGCHTTIQKQWWERLRKFLKQHGHSPPSLIFNVRVVVEPRIRLSIPISVKEKAGYTYNKVWCEGNLADD